MALQDILDKLIDDARLEADAIIASAREEAAAIASTAASRSAAEAEAIVAIAARADGDEAETIRARARLEARDAILTARRALIAEARSALEERIADLSAGELAALLTPSVLAEVREGERIVIGSGLASDAREALAEKFIRAGIARDAISDSGDPVDTEVRVEGDRMGATVSVASVLAAQADRLEDALMTALFDEGAV